MNIDVELRIKDGEPVLTIPLEENLSGDILKIMFDDSNKFFVEWHKDENGYSSVSLKTKKD